VRPPSLANRPSDWDRRPLPADVPSNAICVSRSGSRASSSATAPLPGSASMLRLSRRRVRMPSGVSAAASRARTGALACRHTSHGLSWRELSMRSTAIGMVGRAESAVAISAQRRRFRSGSVDRPFVAQPNVGDDVAEPRCWHLQPSGRRHPGIRSVLCRRQQVVGSAGTASAITRSDILGSPGVSDNSL